MIRRQRTLIIGSIVLLAQVFLFRNYLPFVSNQIIVKGQSCTCPHAKVQSGEWQLKRNTPDSLIKYNLDYSEIYFENEISTTSDPMGVNTYFITGKIVGKSSISEGDGYYYPLFKIHSFHDVILYNLLKWLVLGLLSIEFLLLISMVMGIGKTNKKTI